MISYATAILEGFRYLLSSYPEVFVLGQGLWSPWYVGQTMQGLDKEFGTDRVMDSPVSEDATTGVAIGASLGGFRPIVVHPRMDFMILATNQIINQAAKWSHMFGGQAHPAVTIRGIINRGGEQGAQHSQALHAWFAHIPGLRVVMPATPGDARDLLIASVLCDDPVVYIDDRWLYDVEAALEPVQELPLSELGPQVVRPGKDLSLLACGYSTQLCLEASHQLDTLGIDAEVVDLRILNPLSSEALVRSVKKTGRLLAVDGGWRTCGMAGEVLARIAEQLPLACWKSPPGRLTLPDAPAPTSRPLEENYYLGVKEIVDVASHWLNKTAADLAAS